MGAFTTFAMLPVLVPQALWVKFRAAQLSEAAGPRQGRQGEGPRLRVLIVGDSSGAGVGVAEQKIALSGRLAAHLSQEFDVSWRLEARCGATTTTILNRLEDMEAEPFDIAVIAVGVNDAKNGMREALWIDNYNRLIDLLEKRFSVTDHYASGIPPLQHFPVLPEPLRNVLGKRASAFDARLREVLQKRTNTHYVNMEFPLDPTLMASDGFHPGPEVYDQWALRISRLVCANTALKSRKS
ncbi:MAG: SGNH/GDSL hydrolase family protein [Pseudomonadota bacterium]